MKNTIHHDDGCNCAADHPGEPKKKRQTVEQNPPGKGATIGNAARLTGGQRRVTKYLQAYYKQGKRWYKVGAIIGQGGK